MFTRMMICTVKPEKKDAFLEAARRLAEAYKGQTGFVDLLTFVSDEHPNQAIVAAVWKNKTDSAEFYKDHAPLLDLKPFLEQERIEHYYLEASEVYRIAGGIAA